ncbi:Glycine cleavage system P-protein domain containing protein [Aphelenchoides besseyi]|nr:Glycine cleavage system P-protein domain containing protein [Aphelenchoides besseyi]
MLHRSLFALNCVVKLNGVVVGRKLNGRRGLSTSKFADRHIGPSIQEQREMLDCLGYNSLEQLCDRNVPTNIRLNRDLKLPEAMNEREMLKHLKSIADRNQIYRSYIGMGFHDCIMPSVIRRNMLENAGWLASYTPYQPEISQGRLESLLNFQTMISDLTGLPVANASLLDEASACAEGLTLACRATKRSIVLYDEHLHPQNLDLLKTRAEPLNIQLVPLDANRPQLSTEIAAVILQYPNTEGKIASNIEQIIVEAHQHGTKLCYRLLPLWFCDPLALTILRSPGELNADICVGTAQRFGLPLSYGGPHPGFIAVAQRDERNSLARMMPGRIVGVSVDADGNLAYRLTWQAREQHIRRDKATSNICTAQALTANITAMFAVYHGPQRLAMIATQVHRTATFLAERLRENGVHVAHDQFFDTIKVRPIDKQDCVDRCEQKQINVRHFDDGNVGISIDETVGAVDVLDLLFCFGIETLTKEQVEVGIDHQDAPILREQKLARTTDYLTHKVFNSYHSEVDLIRYMKRLENRDLSLVHSMIPLGSCTMKLNASSQLTPITWDKFSALHPFAPQIQAQGYAQIFNEMNQYLCEITGYDKWSFQPNSGANGEYAGLLAIRGYQKSLGQEQRNICLIPQSAHGTNPASAQMCGFQVKGVASDKFGNIDYEDLCQKVGTKTKVEKYKNELGAFMITYPSTHGVFEERVRDVCAKIHENGGQVYLDGANFNAQVGLCRPGDYGGDVSHLNLHKTFCIPRGGGGPGAGPIGVRKHLAPFLPGHPVISPFVDGRHEGAVCSSPWGPSNILMITWAYIRLMGASGLKNATEVAILNANYMAKRLEEGGYNILFRNQMGLNAHEFLVDCKPFGKFGVGVMDIAKRLMDYGYHSPTVSFPVNGCLMIEPTESESKAELDRYIEALLKIRVEIEKIATSEYHPTLNPIKMAPHTTQQLTTDWNRPYSRVDAVFPTSSTRTNKFWPAVGRIDEKHGDMNFFCNCPTVDDYDYQEDPVVEQRRAFA